MKMHDAGLDLRLRKHGVGRVREPLQAVDDRVERGQRPRLPATDLLEHRIGHRRNQLRRGLDAA